MKLVTKILVVLLLTSVAVNAQVLKAPKLVKGSVNTKQSNGLLNKSNNVDGKSTKAIKIDTKASDYKFISVDNDTTYIDTTLSIKKEYK